MTLLDVKSLGVAFRTLDGVVNAVNDVSLAVERGRVLGIVGESGSGKSVACRAIMGLVQGRSVDVSGEVLFNGRDLLAMGSRELRAVRGQDIAMIFQDPMSGLNPVRSIGSQLVEAIRLHGGDGRRADWQRSRDMLAAVGIPNPDERMKAYPIEFSGGMRQRVMIAMALVNRPDLLIADEPTTALDVTTQAQVLSLMRDMRRDTDSAIILITHDLGVIAQLCDDVLVMYAGRIVESGPVDRIFHDPRHPYTWGLLASLPTMNTDATRIRSVPGSPPSPLAIPPGCPFHPRCDYALDECRSQLPPLIPVSAAGIPGSRGAGHLAACHLRASAAPPTVPTITPASLPAPGPIGKSARPEPILRVEGLSKDFPVSRGAFGHGAGVVRAVTDVSFTIQPGETLAIVGESGCGKSTLARCIARLVTPSSGTIVFQDRDISSLGRRAMMPIRRDMMVVFQDPYGSLDPRMRVGDIIAEPLDNYHYGPRAKIRQRVQEMLEIVGLNPEHYNRFPHEFSGGQRQRVGIARALALGPRLLVCDEPVSALDVSVQAQILNLLADLRDELGLTYVFISHNLDVVRHIADRVLVMYLGRVVEDCTVDDLFTRPKHPYTAALLSAVLVPDPESARNHTPIVLEGDVPSPFAPPTACAFHPRCPRMQPLCAEVDPQLRELGAGHLARCHFPLERWPFADPDEIRIASGVHDH